MDGRVAIVTGASRGIGRHIAERLAAEGAAVALVARTVTEGSSPLPGSLEEAVETINSRGGRAAAIPADLTAPADVETIVERARAALGPVDTLVNNAGVNFYGPALGLPPRRYEVMYQIMVHTPFRLAQLAIPGMVERGRGWIVNITSKQARHPLGRPTRSGPATGAWPTGCARRRSTGSPPGSRRSCTAPGSASTRSGPRVLS